MSIIIKNLKIIFLITATMFISALSCNKEGTKPCYSGARYSFNVTSEFSPQLEVYNVGDTVFFKSTFPTILLDAITNTLIDYSNNIGVGGTFTLSSFDTIAKQLLPARDSFELKFQVGKFEEIPVVSSRNYAINLIYELNNNFEIILAVICKKKGIYQLAITDLGSQGIRGQNCTNAGFNMTVTNSNKNLNLFQYALGYPADALHIKNIYCFRVK